MLNVNTNNFETNQVFPGSLPVTCKYCFFVQSKYFLMNTKQPQSNHITFHSRPFSAMKKFPFFIVVTIVLTQITACFSSSKQKTQTPILLIQNINIVDVESGKIIPSQQVLIKDSIIRFIGSSIPEKSKGNTIVINGTGKYLVPGLWDMHFHLCWMNNNDSLLFPVLLKKGITGIRDMGGDLQIMNSFKSRIKNKGMPAPEIYGAGPIIDGNPPVQPDFSLPVDDNTNMPHVLDSLSNKGAAFFKVYSLIKENQLRATADYCKTHHMQFEGHLSEYIDPKLSISLGQKSVEHLNRIFEIWQEDKAKLDEIGNMMVAQKSFLCPTVITYYLKTKLRDSSIVKPAYEQYITPSLRNEWQTLWTKRIKAAEKKGNENQLNDIFESQKKLIAHLANMGVMILAGSDFAGMPYVYPGIGLQEELKLLATCGLSNLQVLQSATINPAIFMGKEHKYGSVTIGKYADLIIVENNPLTDISNIQTIKDVIIKGQIIQAAHKEN